MTKPSLFSLALLMTAAVSQSQTAPDLTGDFSGILGPLHIKLHITRGAGSGLTCSLDSIDQGASGLRCAQFKLSGGNVAFEVPSAGGRWHGSVSADGKTLDGKWLQGSEIPLLLQRDQDFVAAEKPSRVDGIWLGTPAAGGARLRLQLHIKSDLADKEFCAIDSLDQNMTDAPCANAMLQGDAFSFDVPLVHGSWRGVLNQQNDTLAGTWSQGQSLPLILARQTAAIALPKPHGPAFDAAIPLVSGDQWKSVLDGDFADAVKTGILAPANGTGVTIGIVQHGVRHVLVYGQGRPDTLYEIGSITKTFTGLVLAQMVVQHKVHLDEPLRELLPPNAVAKPNGAEIALVDLATQHSGLPRMPDNFAPADANDPYADYGVKNLLAYIGKHGVAKPDKPAFEYSNLGFGLLGTALAHRAGLSYPELLQREVTAPLSLSDTVVKLSPGQAARFAQGHNPQHRPARPWAQDAMAGAGAIRSTAGDMLTYLEAQLHPDSRIDGVAPATEPQHTLPDALRLSHKLRADAIPSTRIGFAWFCDTNTSTYWHNGATGGYSSYAFFNPHQDYAGVVLFNETVSPDGSFADRVGEHLRQRLTGKPAVTLSSP